MVELRELLLDVVDPVAFLHLPREMLLVRGREQEHPPDLAQVHAHRVVDAFALFGQLGQRHARPRRRRARFARPAQLDALRVQQVQDREAARDLGLVDALRDGTPGRRLLRRRRRLGRLLGRRLGPLREVDRALPGRHRELIDGGRQGAHLAFRVRLRGGLRLALHRRFGRHATRHGHALARAPRPLRAAVPAAAPAGAVAAGADLGARRRRAPVRRRRRAARRGCRLLVVAALRGLARCRVARPRLGRRCLGGRRFGGRPLGGRRLGDRCLRGRCLGGRRLGDRCLRGRRLGGRCLRSRRLGARPLGGRRLRRRARFRWRGGRDAVLGGRDAILGGRDVVLGGLARARLLRPRRPGPLRHRRRGSHGWASPFEPVDGCPVGSGGPVSLGRCRARPRAWLSRTCAAGDDPASGVPFDRSPARA